MIQSAHIGFGIQGNEGNAAASFSDYAVTKFSDLRRLIFWHGYSFGQKASNFMMWFAFKGMLFSAPILFFNTVCGYSGTTYIEDLYFALYEVLMTTFAIAYYLCLDQDVSFSESKESLPFSLSEYYSYKIKTFFNIKLKRFIFWTVYMWYSAVMMFYVPFYATTRIENNAGHVGGLWGAGYASFTILITAHHVMICNGTRNFSPWLVFAYVMSYLMFMPLVTVLNENMAGGATYKSIFPTVIGGTPLYWLSVFFAVTMICLPLYMLKAYEMVVNRPDFYHQPVKKEQ